MACALINGYITSVAERLTPELPDQIPVALATFYRRWFIENFKRDVLGVASRRRRLKTRCKSEEAARIGRYGPWDCSDGPTRAAMAI